jgi:hypothetical protein
MEMTFERFYERLIKELAKLKQDRPVTWANFIELFQRAGEEPKPEVYRPVYFQRAVYQPLHRELISLQQEHKEKTANLSEEDAARVPRNPRLEQLEWQHSLALRNLGDHINAFRAGYTTEVAETPEQEQQFLREGLKRVG